MATLQKPTTNWREAALERSVVITDAWEVTKTYAGRIADWVLFLCMVMNIIEILVALPTALSNIVLGTQVVMLDIGGFSLANMADQARQQGNEKAARRASRTGWFLIGVTITTLMLVCVGLLWPETASFVSKAEKGLILVRVMMTVIYGHVIHSLRRVEIQQKTMHTQVEELAKTVNQQMDEQTQMFTRQLEIAVNTVAIQIRQSQRETGQSVETILQGFHERISLISEQLSSLNSLQNSETILQDSDSELSNESEEDEEPEIATEADGAKVPGRKYYVTFEAASELTGLSVLQLKRRVNLGEIEVNPHGKVRVKSLDNLQRNPTKKTSPKSKETQTFPALQLVKKA